MARPAISLAAVALLALARSASATPLVVNGSFEDPFTSGSTFVYTTGLSRTIDIPGWTTTSDLTALINTPLNTYLLWSSTPSPDGGNFLAADGSFGIGTTTQTLHGLNPGHSYTLSFYQAAGQLNGNIGATQEQWAVTIGGSLVSSSSVVLPDSSIYPGSVDVVSGYDDTWTTPLMSTPSGGFTPWQHESYSFVANASDELLGFLGLGAPQGVPPMVLLDGVSVEESAPEPTTFALLGVGLVGMLSARAKRRR
jgi:PEP-CTERM motif